MKKYARMFEGMKKVVDEDALTAEDVARELLMSVSHTTKICRAKVDAGEWEQVWKSGKHGMVRAFRPKK